MSIESAPLDTDGFEEDGDEDFGGHVTAALGNTWSHAVNTRLIVQYLDDNYRQVRQLPQKYKLTECCEPYLDCLGILLISCVLEGGGGGESSQDYKSISLSCIHIKTAVPIK